MNGIELQEHYRHDCPVLGMALHHAVAEPRPTVVDRPLPHWQQALSLIERHLPFTRRSLSRGRRLQTAGESFTMLHVLHTGVAKIVSQAEDGREQFIGVQFKGDWIGLDGIASGQCTCDAIALDTSDVWSLHYDTLLDAAARVPALMHALHRAMSAQLGRERASRLALVTLGAEARVADFICCWADSLHERGLRSDRILMTLTRADIASCLGLSHESVSRGFSRLTLRGLLGFGERTRREIMIPDIGALAGFVRRSLGDTEPSRRSILAAGAWKPPASS